MENNLPQFTDRQHEDFSSRMSNQHHNDQWDADRRHDAMLAESRRARNPVEAAWNAWQGLMACVWFALFAIGWFFWASVWAGTFWLIHHQEQVVRAVGPDGYAWAIMLAPVIGFGSPVVLAVWWLVRAIRRRNRR